MLFPTLDFALFFVPVFVLAWAVARWRVGHKLFLTAASYVFYGFWDWRFCLLLAALSLFSHACGRALEGGGRPRLLAVAVAVPLATLGVFKYFDFFSQSLAAALEAAGLTRDLPILSLVLPVGISFIVFHGVSYVVDVHAGRVKAARSPLDVMLYMSFFPHLVAGPIVRAGLFLPQLEAPPDRDAIRAGRGLLLILVGCFKKVVVAGWVGVELVDPVFLDPGAHGVIDLTAAAYGYAVQIYCDFSAYSDMAIGLAALLGYRFPRNFDRPYASRSFREFWRRWHITLSEFLRDYLYIPLGGDRRGAWRTALALGVTMLLGGLWHGAAWTFVLWGGLHGLLLAIERLIGRGLGWFLTLHGVIALWILFRAPSIELAREYLGALATAPIETTLLNPLLALLIVGTFAAQAVPEGPRARLTGAFVALGPVERGVLLGLGLAATAALAPGGVPPFIYFQF